MLKTVDAIQDGTARPCAQDLSGLKPDQAVAPKLTRETGLMDWSTDAERLHNLVRGLSPRPGAYCSLVLEGKELELKVYSTAVVAGDVAVAAGAPEILHRPLPGTVFTDGRSCIMVRCGSGILSLLEIQAPAKKRMDARSFLAGWRGALK